MIVRHARAGNKRRWSGPDGLRPLDDVGELQAISLVDTLGALAVRRLITSPAVRCVQTLQPFAVRSELPIEISSALGPDADGKALLRRLTHPSLDGAVLCTHGEVMRPMLRHIRRQTVPVAGTIGARGYLLGEGNDLATHDLRSRGHCRAAQLSADQLYGEDRYDTAR
jgi:phosphohistidine phosphatase SixA